MNFDFSQTVRTGRVVAQRSEFVLYQSMNGKPMERSKMRRDIVTFGNTQNKASSTVLNFLYFV